MPCLTLYLGPSSDAHAFKYPPPQLMYWPRPDMHAAASDIMPLPRRAFLVAIADVPAYAELTWNYGEHFERKWLQVRTLLRIRAHALRANVVS